MVALFVHGCFWHQHPKCKRATMPKSRTEFWEQKLSRNVARDRETLAHLTADGWRVEFILGVRNQATRTDTVATQAYFLRPKKKDRSQEHYMKAVFDTKTTSIYDDDISSHYHFPRRYLSIVERAVGDWVIFRRPRADGGNLAYFAAARVTGIDPDVEQHGMSYARIADFLKFDSPVAWTVGG